MAGFYYMGGTGSQMTEKELKKMKENLKRTMGANATENEMAKAIGKEMLSKYGKKK